VEVEEIFRGICIDKGVLADTREGMGIGGGEGISDICCNSFA